MLKAHGLVVLCLATGFSSMCAICPAQDSTTLPSAATAPAKADPASLPLVLDLKRPSGTDLLMLRTGDQLTGTVLNESFSIRTSYSLVKLNNRMIAGMGQLRTSAYQPLVWVKNSLRASNRSST